MGACRWDARHDAWGHWGSVKVALLGESPGSGLDLLQLDTPQE